MAAESKRTAGDALRLPPEIWSKILNRLPAKSVLRCRSVCKSWYSLVSCPKFISDYTAGNLTQNRVRNRLLLLLHDGREDACSFSSHDESFAEAFLGPEHNGDDSPKPFRGREHDDDVPEAFLGPNVQIVGSCNGLICLSRYDLPRKDPDIVTFLIWNPTISKVVELPSRTLGPSYVNISYFGFGFDSMTSDYKVLCMCTDFADMDLKDGDFSDVVANVCGIYDLSKGVWRGITPLVHPWVVGRTGSECYLDGAVHWTGYRYGKNSERTLLSFDMSDEIFRETRMPGCAEFTGNGNDDDSYIQTQSVTFDGLIHVIVWDVEPLFGRPHDCSIWAMKEYGVTESWTKLFNFNLLSSPVFPASDPSTFRLWKNDEVLMVHDYNDVMDDSEDFGSHEELALYNIGSRTCKRLCSFSKSISNLCLYEESLVLL